MSKRRRLVVGNWKMHGRLTSSLVLVREIIEKVEAAKPLPYEMVICPPAPLIWPISEATMGTPVRVGGQDCHTATHGAYTGDVSAAMLADLGCRYVILGHSERREAHGETSALVAQKVKAAQLAGLTAIVCVGETAAQMEAGETASVITAQVRESLPENVLMAQLVMAYEPIWAIGTGLQPSADDITQTTKIIRAALGATGEVVPVLYGGSVSPSTAGRVLNDSDADGVLVGSASLNTDGFWAIAEKCE